MTRKTHSYVPSCKIFYTNIELNFLYSYRPVVEIFILFFYFRFWFSSLIIIFLFKTVFTQSFRLILQRNAAVTKIFLRCQNCEKRLCHWQRWISNVLCQSCFSEQEMYYNFRSKTSCLEHLKMLVKREVTDF